MKPEELQEDRVVRARLEKDENAQLSKVVLEHRNRVTTRYSIKNNGSRSAPSLYIEHTARTDCGGFSITSTEHVVKQTTGWARSSEFEEHGKSWQSHGKIMCRTCREEWGKGIRKGSHGSELWTRDDEGRRGQDMHFVIRRLLPLLALISRGPVLPLREPRG